MENSGSITLSGQATGDKDSEDNPVGITGKYWNITSGIGADTATSSSTSSKAMSFTFWDSTEETTPGTNSQYTFLRVEDFIVDQTDDVAPNVVVNPFFWEGEGEGKNSLYKGSKANGHIELEADLTEAIKTLYGNDPKVSGKIVIQGTAYDETLLGKLSFSMTNFKSSTTTALTMAEFKTTTGENGKKTSAWTVESKKMESDSYEVTVENEYMNQNGHKVKWTVAIDTAALSDVAHANAVFTVIAGDQKSGTANSSVSSTGTATGTTDATKHKPAYQMDVVPYITGIKTDNRSASGLKDNNIRSASGKYSILANNEANVITLTGFNFSTDSFVAKIANKATSAGTTITATEGGTGLTSDTNTATITNSGITNSGYLEIFSNGVRALNNINNNNAYGVAKNAAETQLTKDNASVSDYAQAYNREPDYYTTKNVQLTDDRYLRFFDMHKTNTKNGYYPVMIMDEDDPVFGFVDSNGDSQGTITNGWANYYMPQRVKYSGSTGAASSYEYLCGATTWEQMAMAKDDSGRYVHTSVYNRTGGGMEFFYDRFGALSLSTASGYNNPYFGWARGVIIDNYYERDVRTFAAGNTALCLDGLNYQGLLVDRYQNIKLLAVGDSTSSAGATIYQAYYDDNSTEILFRNFKIGTSTTLGNSMTNRMRANQKASDGKNFTQYTNLTEVTSNDAAAPGRNSVATTGSKYYDFGVTSNRAVFVYYDFNEGRLKLMYSSADVTGDPSVAVTFVENDNVKLPDYVGQYVSMAIDDDGGIHIAAFDANDSDLKYIYLTSYDASSFTEMIVDATGSVGNWTSIKIKNNVPYIAYYNATETGGRDAIKLAYANAEIGSITDGIDSSTNYTATGWEYMTIPSVDPAQGGSQKFQQVCLDFDTAGKPVVGYLGTNLEFGKWLDE